MISFRSFPRFFFLIFVHKVEGDEDSTSDVSPLKNPLCDSLSCFRRELGSTFLVQLKICLMMIRDSEIVLEKIFKLVIF
jgi:hypothetical protein